MIERIQARHDSRLDPYRQMKERTLRGDSLFIAEGELVVGRLIASPYDVLSVLLTDRLLPAMKPRLAALPETTPIYILDENELRELVGFDYYQGILAVGGRREFLSVESLSSGPKKSCWVVLPETTKPDNLGLIFRSCAALDVAGVILGERCCDPFSRRALRVSMGGVLQTPIYRSENLAADLFRLQDENEIELYATVLDDSAERLPDVKVWPERTAFVFGNEFDGLAEPWISRCRRRITIPMNPDVDSLNIGVAAGIFLYEFSKSNFGSSPV